MNLRQSAEAEMPDESMEELYESAPCGYLCCAADGTIVRINRTLLEWLGYQREEILRRRRFVELLTLPGRVFHETHMAPLLHMQGFINEVALDFICKDERRLPTLLNCKQVRNDAGVLFLRMSVFNAADRRRYERELLLERRKAELAAKSKAEFLATASHEIRNHLHSIAAVTQLFVAGPTPEQHDRYVQLLAAASSSLLSLVDDILDYSKIEAGKLALEERPFHLRDVFQSVVQGMRARAELRKIALLMELDERIPPLMIGDPLKISQVLTNLCTNALKFTDKGSIKLWARAQELGPGGTKVLLGVTDTGRGIPEKDLPALCDEFTSVSREGDTRVRGTGLGLSICKRILSLYGSALAVESKQGQGSTFSFELALPTADLPRARDMLGDMTGHHSLRGVRLLVALPADGSRELDAQSLTRLLKDWDADFDLVDSGSKAVECVRQSEYDLVLMDTHLSESDSSRTTRAIRELDSDVPAPLPIIALGTTVEPGQRERLAGLGYTDFLAEPLESDLLFRSIARHASLHRALRGNGGRSDGNASC